MHQIGKISVWGGMNRVVPHSSTATYVLYLQYCFIKNTHHILIMRESKWDLVSIYAVTIQHWKYALLCSVCNLLWVCTQWSVWLENMYVQLDVTGLGESRQLTIIIVCRISYATTCTLVNAVGWVAHVYG